MENFKISAGNQELDNWLNGGYDKDIITTFYGPAGSGKTNFCMLAAATQTLKSNKVIFMDTEGGFSIERFRQLTEENYEPAIKNIFLLTPTSFEEQKDNFKTLLREIKQDSNVSLIVVDGMTMLYRLELSEAIQNKDEIKIRNSNRELANQLRLLAEISRKKKIPVLVTNQIYYGFLSQQDLFEGKEKKSNMVGGDLLKYWSKCHIELKSGLGKRTAILKKHRSLPEKEFSFSIIDKGLKKKGIF